MNVVISRKKSASAEIQLYAGNGNEHKKHLTFLFTLLIILIVKFVIIGSLIGVKLFVQVLSPATQNFITLSKSLFGLFVI